MQHFLSDQCYQVTCLYGNEAHAEKKISDMLRGDQALSLEALFVCAEQHAEFYTRASCSSYTSALRAYATNCM